MTRPPAAMRLVAAALVTAVVLAGCTSGGHHPTPLAHPGSLPAIVVDSADAATWVRLLRATGLAVRTGTLGELTARGAGVVPESTRLTAKQRDSLASWVRRGGRLVTADDGVLTATDWRRRSVVTATAATMVGLAGVATWSTSLAIRPLVPGPHLAGVQPLSRVAPPASPSAAPASPSPAPATTTPAGATDPNPLAGSVLMAGAQLGTGAVLALAFDPVGNGRDGHELFPTLGTLVAKWTQAPRGPSRNGIEMYLDPGGLHGALKGDPNLLADRLKGVRAVELAGWNFSTTTPATNYDYAALISALHARGILVYAWLEPPFVNQQLWNSHPECRERTETGRDAFVDWRQLMALEDPSCFSLAWAQWRDLLTRYDWDGVNVAELYFEPSTVPADFTPFHPSALAGFGHDPSTDPQGFLQYRQDLVVRLNQQMLSAINGLPRAKQLDFQLTVIDDHLDPGLARSVGSNDSRLAAVARQGGASLQVEDPSTTWSAGPLRYDGLVAKISPLMERGQAYVDVNVVDRPGAKPTTAMTGTELDLAVKSAAQTSGRVALYSAGTIGVDDLAVLPAAMAGAAQTLDTGIRSPWSVQVSAPDPADDRLTVDGVAWPAGPGTAIVPAGEHRLDWSAGPPAGPSLLRFTGELAAATVGPASMGLSYDSRAAVYVIVSQAATGLLIDGAGAPIEMTGSQPGQTVLRLPAGTHHAELRFSR